MINKVKGTQDFIDTSLLNFVIEQTKKHLNEYNFSEIYLPIIEHTELFQRSLGTETDVVSKEMFIIEPKNKENIETICLRPEATASTVRAFVENNIQTLPWKVFTWGPMFRYERPQKGRFRQFNQVSIEVIGAKHISQDALLIKMLDKLFKDRFLLDNYAILINFLGCYEDRKRFETALKNFLEKEQAKICDTCQERKIKNPLRIFDCKNPECQELYKNAPITTEYLCAECNAEWQILQNTLELISVSFAVLPTLVRGLDYYNKTVFEFSSANLGAQSTFCGGGRYDSLVKEISQEKQDQPSLGAAFGIERIILLLEQIIEKLPIKQNPAVYLILPFSTKQHILGLLISNQLHASNITCDILLEDASVKNLMKKANKIGAKYLIIIGENEQNNREVTLKNMVTGTEEIVKQIELVEKIKSLK